MLKLLHKTIRLLRLPLLLLLGRLGLLLVEELLAWAGCSRQRSCGSRWAETHGPRCWLLHALFSSINIHQALRRDVGRAGLYERSDLEMSECRC